MKILGSHTVELEGMEKPAHGEFECLLSDGFSVLDSAGRVQEIYPGLDTAFYRWLRDEPLIRAGSVAYVAEDGTVESHEERATRLAGMLYNKLCEKGMGLREAAQEALKFKEEYLLAVKELQDFDDFLDTLRWARYKGQEG